MANPVKPIPDGYHSITAYISVSGAAAALDFYKRAFGAVELYRMDMPDGKIGHAEIMIGDSHVMMADEMPDMPNMPTLVRSPGSLGGTTFGFNVYLPDVDAQFQRAVEAGAKVKRPVQTQFYGDRSGTVEDPFGHLWTLSTHVEDVPPEELRKRMAAATH